VENETVKAWVSGADGFAGSWLVENLLEHDYSVIAFVRHTPVINLKEHPKLRIIIGDVLDYPSVQKSMDSSNHVFHLASISGIEETRRDPVLAWNSNTIGTLNVIQACLENYIPKMLYCSTCHVLGNQSSLPIIEENVPAPNDIYSAAKYSSELLCKVMMNMNPRLNIIISRAFNHFGPKQRPAWLIPKIINQALRGNSIILGTGKPTRDFSYVKDIVEGYRLTIEKGRRGEVYNLCSGIERSVESIVNDIIKIMDWKGQVNYTQPREADMARSYGNADKAKRELGWEPKTPWEDALLRTIDYYQGM
jgi:nucleoside-diphosphate-sugar epimerase